MSTQTRPWVRVLTLGGRSAVDLTMVGLLVLTTILSVYLNAPVLVRTPLAILLVFFAPGYVASIVLFPAGAPATAVSKQRSVDGEAITTTDRLILSVGASLTIVIGIGLAIELSPALITAETIVDALGLVILAALPVAHYRRQQLPDQERFSPFGTVTSLGAHNPLRRPALDLLSIVLVVSLVFAGGAIAYSLGGSTGAGGVTEFYFADAETGSDAYPTNMTVGERETLTLGIGNQEGKDVDYRIVGHLDRLERSNGSLIVADTRHLGNRTVSVSAGETRSVTTPVTPRTEGEYRLVYSLYREDGASEDPYRQIHLRVHVDGAGTDE